MYSDYEVLVTAYWEGRFELIELMNGDCNKQVACCW